MLRSYIFGVRREASKSPKLSAAYGRKGSVELQLPNAPLVEVIFEIRWKIETVPAMDGLGYDPGFSVFKEAARTYLNEQGFGIQDERLSEGIPVAHQITHRFRKSEKEPFPLLQIGHGILACNVATEYEWTEFRQFIEFGLETLLANYPITEVSRLNPFAVELRYIDAFNESLLGHINLERFLQESTMFDYGGMEFLRSDVFQGGHTLLKLSRQLSQDQDSWFHCEIASGTADETPALLVTSRVRKTSQEFPVSPAETNFKDFVLDWADTARSVTSPFFQNFVSAELMNVFTTPTVTEPSREKSS